MAKASPTVSDAELEILKILWGEGKATIRQVAARLPRSKQQWAYTTIQTLLRRLEAKGCAVVDKTIVPHVFRASVSRDGLMRQRLSLIADELCDGASSPLLAALVSGQRYSEDEIAQFRQIVDQLEPEGKAASTSKPRGRCARRRSSAQ